MGIYKDVLFPRYYDRVMKGQALAEARTRSLRAVKGETLEIGIGTGQNLAHYPTSITGITAIDPNPGMARELAGKLSQSAVEVEFVASPAEALPFGDARFDTVVSSQALCSVSDIERTLAEVRRVLRPGGRLVFLEHGRDDDPWLARWQRWLTPLQRLFASGCRLDVPVFSAIERSGLSVVNLDRYYMPDQPKTHGSMYEGVALRV